MRQLEEFYLTRPAPCPYLPDKTERKIITPAEDFNVVSVLSRAGFRRTHAMCYTPACEDCQACASVRIPVERFRRTKKLRKILRINEDLDVFPIENIATTEQYELFHKYLAARHKDSDMNRMDYEEYRAMVEDSPTETRLIEFRNSHAGGLEAVVLLDIMDDGLSAVYSFYNPDPAERSLGTLCILNLVMCAAAAGLPYVYLGYAIKDCPSMAYKEKFRPLEAFQNGRWVALPV